MYVGWSAAKPNKLVSCELQGERVKGKGTSFEGRDTRRFNAELVAAGLPRVIYSFSLRSAKRLYVLCGSIYFENKNMLNVNLNSNKYLFNRLFLCLS